MTKAQRKHREFSLNQSVETLQEYPHRTLNRTSHNPPPQWRIQRFPDGGTPTPKVGAKTYYLA